MRNLGTIGVMIVTACGSSPSSPATPAATHPGSSSMSRTTPTPAAPAPASRAATDRLDAPVTPAKIYDGAACTERVKLFDKRVKAALDFSLALADHERTQPMRVPADADLTAPPVKVSLRLAGNGPATDFCGTWGVDIIGGGKQLAIDGKKRLARTVAAVKQRLPKSARLAVHITSSTQLPLVAPLLDKLGALATLQLVVAVEGEAFTIPTGDTPAWALERLRAIRAAGPDPRTPLATAFRDSATACPAMEEAAQAIAQTSSHKGAAIWKEYTRAITKCACTGVDVDALEAIAAYALTNDRRMLTEGWIELRIDPASPTVLAAATVDELGHQLGKLTREQRLAGIKLDIPAPPAALGGRCAGET